MSCTAKKIIPTVIERLKRGRCKSLFFSFLAKAALLLCPGLERRERRMKKGLQENKKREGEREKKGIFCAAKKEM